MIANILENRAIARQTPIQSVHYRKNFRLYF